jgi:c-di-GMP-binding flagellar brake protein YcgR
LGINFELNRKVEVIWSGKIYKSIIQDANEEKEYLAILPPIKNGVILPLHTGEEFEVIYYHEKSIYQFTCKLKGRRYEQKVELLIISYPKEFLKVQRRDFVRVSVMNEVKFVRISNTSHYKEAAHILRDGNGETGILMDISGGGIRLKTNEKTNIGDIIVVDLHLTNSDFVVMGRVVRDEKDETDVRIHGISFMEISERTRDKIIQLIFEIMRKQSKTV